MHAAQRRNCAILGTCCSLRSLGIACGDIDSIPTMTGHADNSSFPNLTVHASCC